MVKRLITKFITWFKEKFKSQEQINRHYDILTARYLIAKEAKVYYRKMVEQEEAAQSLADQIKKCKKVRAKNILKRKHANN